MTLFFNLNKNLSTFTECNIKYKINHFKFIIFQNSNLYKSHLYYLINPILQIKSFIDKCYLKQHKEFKVVTISLPLL